MKAGQIAAALMLAYRVRLEFDSAQLKKKPRPVDRGSRPQQNIAVVQFDPVTA
ncbi:hypothetical protein [Nitrococcus mobilis]|uniref:Uncharacterized protein n=1 Tax=Nitrococcus mobilis Nb-231 TaxID=314278 RepID=A4BPU9_9GAMM|nr:hypothetical protein [Nitrococcus mobilis]EAR22104.1 hypothetical protein NB231_04325 [Nitrococcus mobilis Nb-231]